MADDFVTLMTCAVASEAEAVRLLLENEGIKTFVVDANIVTANWFLGPAVGYVKVQVARSRAQEAAEILRSHPRSPEVTSDDDSDDRPTTCLACGSAMPEDADHCPQCGWSFQTADAQDHQIESGANMGAHAYHYTVPFEPDLQAALDKLRQRVFESKDFNGAEFDPPTPEAALEMTEADGTRSILDISRISALPDFCAAAPVAPPDLIAYFGTEQPTEDQVLSSESFWDSLERGQARYILLYNNGAPAQILFVGYSFD